MNIEWDKIDLKKKPIDHSQHGRGTLEDGPDESDCGCRATEDEVECSQNGCGFCSVNADLSGFTLHYGGQYGLQ